MSFLSVGGGPPYETDRDACCLTKGCKFWMFGPALGVNSWLNNNLSDKGLV